MITTLLCVAAIASPELDKVDFSHSFEKDEVYRYQILAEMPGQNYKLVIDFDVHIKTKNQDRLGAIVTVLKVGNTGMEIPVEMDPMPMSLNKHGIPIDGEYFEKSGLVVYLGLMTNYLPAKEMADGDSFEFDRTTDEFSFKGGGKYLGTKEVKGKEYRVLISKSVGTPAHFAAANLSTEAFYDVDKKKVVMTRSKATVDGNEITLTMRLKDKA